ncbi:MAG: hypothetical protein LBF58_01010 [Deltaproteobacteria bacterium]|jgi:tetratricopeptide (TPR) repeat protein|nr:hypothetical protein [Deltaproteobacteria bacterium]
MLDEDQFQTLLVLGFLFRRLGLVEKAGRLYQVLIAIRPDDRSVLTPAAAAALDEGRAEEALEFLDRFDDGWPGEATAVNYLIRAKALSALHRDLEASRAIGEYLKRIDSADGDR